MKSNGKICAEQHTGNIPEDLAALPVSQAGFWRHKCAACAYEMGVKAGLKMAGRSQRQDRKIATLVDEIRAQLPALRHAH